MEHAAWGVTLTCTYSSLPPAHRRQSCALGRRDRPEAASRRLMGPASQAGEARPARDGSAWYDVDALWRRRQQQPQPRALGTA